MNNYKEIYQLASEIRELEPWTQMEEVDIFGVRIPETKLIYFISVMGNLGEFTAISAYRGLAGLSGFYNIQDLGDALPPETILTVPHFMLSFIDREDLSPEQLASIRSSGHSFRGAGNWPSLGIIEPGFLPVLPEGEGLDDVLIVLQQAVEVIRRCQADCDFLYQEHENYDSMLVREQRKIAGQTEWIDTYIPLPDLESKADYNPKVPESKIEAVYKLPESRTIVQMELALLPAPVQEKGKRGYFPFGLLLADKKRSLMLGMEMLPPLPDLQQMYESVPEKVLDELLKLRYRPSRIDIRSDILFNLTNSFLLRAGCRVLGVKQMDVMDEFLLSLSDSLGGKTAPSNDEVDWEDPEEIYGHFMDLETNEKVALVYELMNHRPDMDEDVLDMIGDVGNELIFLDRPEDLEDLIASFSKIFPGVYEEDYNSTERDLIVYYLSKGKLKWVLKRLRYIRMDPVAGENGVTFHAFFLLLFRGHTQVAIDLARDIWKPMLASEELMGLAHAPFSIALYLNALEEAWIRSGKGEKVNWEKVFNKMVSFGIERDEIRFRMIVSTLETPYNRDEVLGLMKGGSTADLMLKLNIHFLVFMKEKFGVSFALSDLWWNMLMSGGLFGKKKDPEAFFYIGFENLSAHFLDHFDILYRSNELDMFGRVFGLKYVYYFLSESGLIGQGWFQKMMVNIQALELSFERLSKYKLWENTFVFDWPEISPFDAARKEIYQSTHALDELDYEQGLDLYFEDRLGDFPDDIAAKLRLDFKAADYGPEGFYDDFDFDAFDPDDPEDPDDPDDPDALPW